MKAKFAIIVTAQYQGSQSRYALNVKCSDRKSRALAQFDRFLKNNAVQAKLIRVKSNGADGADGAILAQSVYLSPMAV